MVGSLTCTLDPMGLACILTYYVGLSVGLRTQKRKVPEVVRNLQTGVQAVQKWPMPYRDFVPFFICLIANPWITANNFKKRPSVFLLIGEAEMLFKTSYTIYNSWTPK